MAKRHIIPLGRHKPIKSQLSGIVIPDVPRENTEYFCYRTGQQAAMIASYEKHKRAIDKRKALMVLDELLSQI